MSGKNSKAKVMEKRVPGPVKDGLDDDIASFINSLIDQNSQLVNKLEHMDSLKELADRIVLEAHKEAAEIIAGAEKKATAEVRKIINNAKKQIEKDKRKSAKADGILFNGESVSTSPDGRKMCCVLVTRVKKAALQLAEYLQTQGEAVQVTHRGENDCMYQLWEVWSSKYI